MEIKITPRYLRERKQEWEGIVRKAEREYQRAAEQAEKLKEHLGGKRVRRIENNFVQSRREGEEVFKRLQIQILKLEEIAEVYSSTERNNINAATDH